MDNHNFCRTLLRAVLDDDRAVKSSIKAKDFSVTKSAFSGYEVQGPDKFYHYANGADCVAGARAEAIEHYLDDKEIGTHDLPQN